MKFDDLTAAYLKVLTENTRKYLSGQWIDDQHVVLGDSEEPGHYSVAELGEQDVYPAEEMEDTGTTAGPMQIMKWNHTGQDIIVSDERGEDGSYVGFPIEAAFSASESELDELSEGESEDWDEDSEDSRSRQDYRDRTEGRDYFRGGSTGSRWTNYRTGASHRDDQGPDDEEDRPSYRRPVQKEGDVFTDKKGRRWVRVKKADGTLGIKPHKG